MSIGPGHLHSDTPNALPVGTRLGEFELLSLLGVGGFGIVYLAFDHALEREVAVKEYMPASLAGRTETLHVSLRSQSDAETFALGLKSFVNEARLLARFDHPSLLKVLRFWEGNGTAYMAMPVMRGHTVKAMRLDMSDPPAEPWMRTLLEPLLGAIECLHAAGVYHRDIAPDNIQIEPGGRPVLLDFGAARRVISDKSQTLTAILKPAYAPIEQYAEVGSVKQGPWTDIYALGATLHFLLLARPPAPATARAVHDEASALTLQALPTYSANFLHIIDWMLAPRPADRPQSVAMLRDALAGRIEPPHRRSAETPSHWDRTVVLPTGTGAAHAAGGDTARPTLPMPRTEAAAAGRAATFAAPATGFDPDFDRSPAPPPYAAPGKTAAASATAARSTPAKSRLIPVLAGVAAIAVAAVAAALWPRQQPAPIVAASAAMLAPPPGAAAVPPPASLVPESAVATVVLPRTPDAPPTRATGSGDPASATDVATRPLQAPNVRPVSERAAGTAALRGNPGTGNATAPGTAPALSPGLAPATAVAAFPGPAAPELAQPTLAAPAGGGTAVPTTEPPKPATVATGPEARCGTRNPLSYFVCMERECLRSEFTNHGDCLKWHKDARAARRE